jgi:hypothetical protein
MIVGERAGRRADDLPQPHKEVKRITRVAAMLLVVYAVISMARALQIWGVLPAPMLLTVSIIALPLAFGLWQRAGWAWWGTLIVLLFMLAWLALGSFILLVTTEGRSVLLGLLTTPSLALASIVLELLILILLLWPHARPAIHPGAAA